jgi:hypothetical protein
MRVGTTTQYDIFVRGSDDLVNWSAPIRVTSNLNSHDPFACELADQTLLLAYAKHTGGAYNLYRRTSPDGVSWSEELALTADATNNTQPHLLPDDQRLFLIYAHAVLYPSDHDVYLELLGDPSAVTEEDLPLSGGGRGIAGAGRPGAALRFAVHPNPCREAVTLRYRLETDNEVTIELFDPLGRRRLRRTEGCQRPGDHEVRLDLCELPSGISLCRIQAGPSSAIRAVLRIE